MWCESLRVVVVTLFAACAANGLCAPSVSPLPKGPEAWFEFIDGNVRRDGLRRDLESLKEAGFSAVHFFHIGGGAKTVPWPGCDEQIFCMGEKWWDIVRFMGDECTRLGLGLVVQNCPGWSQSGGPWIDLDHCQRDIECARRDLSGGNALQLPEVPEKFRDAYSDWRDICVLAFPTPIDDVADAVAHEPMSVTTNGDERVYSFAKPVTVRSMTLPGLCSWIRDKYCYHAPWLRVTLEAKMPGGWLEVANSRLPVSCWRDYVQTLTISCDEATSETWRYRIYHDFPLPAWGEPNFYAAARHENWEGKCGRVLRSVSQARHPRQDVRAWVDSSKIIDITDNPKWVAPEGRWTVLRFGHVNLKRVNAPAPKEATGWECDKLDPVGIEANFKGYIGRLLADTLKGRMDGMLVDSWECWCQTWTPRMEEYFAKANGYALRKKMPALFGYVLDAPDETDRFLTDWRRTLGDLVTKNYFGRMSELAREAGIKVYYETAFGDIIYGDLLEYWKYADAPMCEYWNLHATKDEGGVGSYAFKPVRPCASAAHIYGKRRVMAEAFTEWGIRWDEDFQRLQDVANRHFARGVTHLALQSSTHVPVPDATPPGACMSGGNGTPFNRLQTWWKYMPEFTGWLTRCEEFLEAGLPSQDVLWYLGDAVDHRPDADYPFPEGFRYDYLNHDVLTNRLAVKDGLFVVPEGTAWKVLWVPDERYMLPATRKRLSELAAAGGKVVFGGKDSIVKALSPYAKDVATEPSLGDEPSEDFMWIHRVVDGFDRYFVAAGTNGWRGKVTFRAKGPVSVFDPVTEERFAWRNGDVLDIPPSRSVFVEFGVVGPVNPANRVKKEIELTDWTLSFPSGWGVPEKVTLERPVSWTEIPGFSREAQAFSGTAVYNAEFECSAENSRLELDIGNVSSVAKVYVNDKAVRTLWCAPWRCRLDGFVRKGRNALRIEVTNTWRNRLIYDLGQPEEDRKTWIILRPGSNPHPTDQFVPSGILGPVVMRQKFARRMKQ